MSQHIRMHSTQAYMNTTCVQEHKHVPPMLLSAIWSPSGVYVVTLDVILETYAIWLSAVILNIFISVQYPTPSWVYSLNLTINMRISRDRRLLEYCGLRVCTWASIVICCEPWKRKQCQQWETYQVWTMPVQQCYHPKLPWRWRMER